MSDSRHVKVPIIGAGAAGLDGSDLCRLANLAPVVIQARNRAAR